MAKAQARPTYATNAKVTVTESPDGASVAIAVPMGQGLRRFDRRKEEVLDKAMKRIRKEAIKAECIREQEVVALLEREGSEQMIQGDTTNGLAWQPGRVLRMGKEQMIIEYNPPTVEKIQMHAKPIVGLPLCPVVELRYADLEACAWRWYRTIPAPKVHRKQREEIELPTPNRIDWQGRIYLPREEDVGHLITVECVPGSSAPGKRTGEPAAYTCNVPVKQNPAVPYAWEARQAHTPCVLAFPRFRVVTYNVLSANYSSTDQAEKLLYPYCDREYLAVDYRKQLVYQELAGFNADIICLQEVDQKVFDEYYQCMLNEVGLRGIFQGKSGTVLEGCALFYRGSKFEILEYKAVSLRQVFSDALNGAVGYDWVCKFLEHRTALADVVCNKVTTVAQVAVLRSKQRHSTSPPVCIVNTHLFFHSLAPHIRMMQLKAILQEAEKVMNEVEAQIGHKPTVLLCGDLNSQPSTGPIELLKNGFVSDGHNDWKRGTNFSWYTGTDEPWEGSSNRSLSDDEDDEDQEGGRSHGMNLAIPFHFKSAGEEAVLFSNFVGGEHEFVGLLDYVFYEPERLKVAATVPTFEQEEIRKDKGLPSIRLPSDHVSLAFDFEFRTTERIQPVPASLANVSIAANALKQETIVAIPTDTLYGLAGRADSSLAVNKIYDIKRRSKNVPLAICIGNVSEVGRYGDTSALPKGLLEDILPGMVTVLLYPVEGEQLCKEVNQGYPTIGIRVPGSPFICRVADALGGALALTSANVSGSGNTVDVMEFEELWPSCSYVFDGGRIQGGAKGSTVIDLSQKGRFRIIRDGEVYDTVVRILEGKYGLVRLT
mmetsp:Transcript_8553/g.53439  ORF Transcript_8553/g.53439 Transcript_8553/m.53439 type:complete len:825 (-) Transcript_8553:527-3001(-)|eukprot:CAMPEP_0183830868 /NCGR_PEP_ID=MMETSP0807_2-20130328/4278_1 /TAXON_ID=88271 /ORGANISM="Picocystis salinarum, Strain CCMP1897" /LENGTH=824 /DNA_ID=CAMNT_0026076263 /DNA_START=102 /DNA_END=2576 /DNA_ORIENTATION=+